MDNDLIIEASPLFFFKSKEEELIRLKNYKEKAQNSTEALAGSYCPPDMFENRVFHQGLLSPETSSLTIGSIEERGAINQDLNTARNNTKQEPTRILDMIKYSPKFLRKKYTRQQSKNVTISQYEQENNGNSQDLNPKTENLENLGSVLPKSGFRQKYQPSENSEDSNTTETKKETTTPTTKCKSPTLDQDSPEVGASKGKINWWKVKAALKRTNDGGEQLKSVLPGNEENSPGDAKSGIKIPSESSINNPDENEEDIYQRLKAFLNSSEKKTKSPRSPRLLLRSKFSFWPKGTEAAYTGTTPIHEDNSVFSSPPSIQFPVLKARMHMYSLGIRRSSAPESVLRREAEAFSLRKKAKDIRLNSQNKALKQVKTNREVPKLNNHRELEIRQQMRLIMKEHLFNLTEYCPEKCGEFSSTISKEITKYLHSTETSVNENEQKKFVCLVYLGAVKGRGIHAATRCMWSPEEDRVVVSDYQNNSLYAIAVVFISSC